MTARWIVLLSVSCLLFLTSACTHSPVAETKQLPVVADKEYSAAAYADNLLAMAIEAEPWITPALSYLAELQQGEMIGLEFRLKSRESTVRKVETRMLEGDYSRPEEIPISDSLRYTIQLGDQPAGHHNQSVAYTLVTMENLGHTVLAVKNYWPRGDDYSGINTILRAPNGVDWELQFHTVESFELKMSSHKTYEEVREPGISPQRRKELFYEVAGEWEGVPIPVDILVPGSLHPLEEVILRPAP